MEYNLAKSAKSIDLLGKAIVGIAISFVTYLVNDIHSDIKELMAVSNISSTKIDAMERRIDKLEQVIFFDKLNKTSSNEPIKDEYKRLVFIRQDEKELLKKKII